MKTSNYNFFFPYEADEGKVIAYNSFSNALALMDKEKYDVFNRFCEGEGDIEDEEFVKQLKAGHFLVDDNYDELNHLRFHSQKNRYNADSLRLTICPTADCNFRCTYCYEKDAIRPDYMSKEIEEAIIELVLGRASNISRLSVAWFGGEPLMNIETLERLSRKFIEICKQNNISYYASIVTNGSLLTCETALLLKELHVGYVQITVDGAKNVHDKRRPFVGGTGSFDTIMDNLINIKSILPQIALRINVDKDNIDHSYDVYKVLENNNLLGIVQPYLGKIVNFNNVAESSSCISDCDFSKEVSRHFNEIVDDTNFMSEYPRRHSCCVAENISAHIINADGEIYKCLVDIGNLDKSIGNLVGDKERNTKTFLEYMLYDPTSDTTCSKCDILPLCMGGCAYKRLSNMETCNAYKFTLDSHLKIIAKKLKLRTKPPTK